MMNWQFFSFPKKSKSDTLGIAVTALSAHKLSPASCNSLRSFQSFQFYVKFIIGDAKTDYLFPRSNVFWTKQQRYVLVKKHFSTCRPQPTTIVAVCYLAICEPCFDQSRTRQEKHNQLLAM
jgi:hypothetical protein